MATPHRRSSQLKPPAPSSGREIISKGNSAAAATALETQEHQEVRRRSSSASTGSSSTGNRFVCKEGTKLTTVDLIHCYSSHLSADKCQIEPPSSCEIKSSSLSQLPQQCDTVKKIDKEPNKRKVKVYPFQNHSDIILLCF